jgi:hypothetical protein
VNARLDYALTLSLIGSKEYHSIAKAQLRKVLASRTDALLNNAYKISLLYYSLGDFENARFFFFSHLYTLRFVTMGHFRTYCEMLYRENPDSMELGKLHLAISYKHNQKTKEDDMKTAVGVSAAVGVGVAILGIVGFALTRSRAK